MSNPVPSMPHKIEGIKPPRDIENLTLHRHPETVGSVDETQLLWTPPTLNIYGQPTTLDHQEIYAGTTAPFAVDAAHLLATVGPTVGSYLHQSTSSWPVLWYYLVVAVDTAGNRSGVGRNLPSGIDDLKLVTSRDALVLWWSPVTTDLDGRPPIVDHYVLYGSADTFRRSQIAPALIVPGFGNISGTATSLPAPAGSIYYYSVIVLDNKGAESPW